MTEYLASMKKYALQSKSEKFRLEMLKDIRKLERNLLYEPKDMVQTLFNFKQRNLIMT